MASIFLLEMTTNIWVFPSTIKSFCVLLFSSGMTATSFAAQRAVATANRLITVVPIFVSSLCPPTSTSSADSYYCVRHSFEAFGGDESVALTLPVCRPKLEASSPSVVSQSGTMHRKTQHPRTSPRFGCCISPRLTANKSRHETSAQRWGKVQVLCCSQVTRVTHRAYHSHSGQGWPQAMTLPPPVMESGHCVTGSMHRGSLHARY